MQQAEGGSGQGGEEDSGPVDEPEPTFPPVGFTQLASSPGKAIRILENTETGVNSGAKCAAAGARPLTLGSSAEMSEAFQMVQSQANTKKGRLHLKFLCPDRAGPIITLFTLLLDRAPVWLGLSLPSVINKCTNSSCIFESRITWKDGQNTPLSLLEGVGISLRWGGKRNLQCPIISRDGDFIMSRKCNSLARVVCEVVKN